MIRKAPEEVAIESYEPRFGVVDTVSKPGLRLVQRVGVYATIGAVLSPLTVPEVFSGAVSYAENHWRSPELGCITPAAGETDAILQLVDNESRMKANAAAFEDLQASGISTRKQRNAIFSLVARQNGLHAVPFDSKTYQFMRAAGTMDDTLTLDASLAAANDYAVKFGVHIALNDETVHGKNAAGETVETIRPLDETDLTADEREAVKDDLRATVTYLSMWPKEFAADFGLKDIKISAAGEPIGNGLGVVEGKSSLKTGTIYLVYDAPKMIGGVSAYSDPLATLTHETFHFSDAKTCGSPRTNVDPAISAENEPGFHYSSVLRPLPALKADENTTHVSMGSMLSPREDKAETLTSYVFGATTAEFHSPNVLGKLSVVLARLRSHFPGKDYAGYIIDIANLP